MPVPLLLLLALLALAAGPGCAPPPRGYWVPDTIPVERVDYTDWNGVLSDHVREGRVDYGGIARDPRFAPFVDLLRRGRFTRETTHPQRLAFLVNGYNALAISGILRGGSPAGLMGRRRFFQRETHRIAGEEITLYDLEHERIRPFGEPRIHFAIVCASASCPRLASEAFLPERLDAQFDTAARSFVNDAARNRFDLGRRRAVVSRIFDWYAEDFVATDGSVAAYLSRYAADPELSRSLASESWQIGFLPYDWSLNGARPPAAE